LTYNNLSDGDIAITSGSPAGVLIAGIALEVDRCNLVDFKILARNDNNTSFTMHYQSAWEYDFGATQAVEVGCARATIWRGPGSGDWGCEFEQDGNGTLQLRGIGTLDGAFDCRWQVTGDLTPVAAPSVQI
jgi:hypothetical protein